MCACLHEHILLHAADNTDKGQNNSKTTRVTGLPTSTAAQRAQENTRRKGGRESQSAGRCMCLWVNLPSSFLDVFSFSPAPYMHTLSAKAMHQVMYHNRLYVMNDKLNPLCTAAATKHSTLAHEDDPHQHTKMTPSRNTSQAPNKEPGHVGRLRQAGKSTAAADGSPKLRSCSNTPFRLSGVPRAHSQPVGQRCKHTDQAFPRDGRGHVQHARTSQQRPARPRQGAHKASTSCAIKA
jgi:hypothetical protein